jgi:asparagine synthase (glutamine-hydrolysing)
MSIQFGRYNFDGKPVDRDYLQEVARVIAPYGPDGGTTLSRNSMAMLYHSFHTTKESRSEQQPHVCSTGSVLTWDGRLDNRTELIEKLPGFVETTSTDLDIVAAAYENWGTRCFARFIGDWALAIWDPSAHSVILAKDFAGIRHLYYSFDGDHITWSTILDPLALLERKHLALCEEYIAGWFSLFPAVHLTPYIGIHAVPASSFALVRSGKCTIEKYWDFNSDKNIRYRSDLEYEEHFRAVFSSAVRRRLRSDAPILAELSGGMDSSSIVCVADTLLARGAADTPRLDTLSYYDDSEPNWNERPFIAKVEEKRGQIGRHIDINEQEILRFGPEIGAFPATPSSGGGRPTEASRQFAAHVALQGNRVILSGIGGDETTGGVPTPVPELMNLLATARFKALASQLKLWALNKRKPWFHLLLEASRGFLPPLLVGVPKHLRPVIWLQPTFLKRHRAALTGYPSRVKLFGPLPHIQENLATLESLRRQLACSTPSLEPTFEKRYPFLDRDLLEFMYAIPREQLVRPGQRRSLMRRALVGIVPSELLNRRRKAFVSRSPMAAISRNWASLTDTCSQMISTDIGIIDAKAFREVLLKARRGEQVPVVTMMRTLTVESWLKNLQRMKPLHFEYRLL